MVLFTIALKCFMSPFLDKKMESQPVRALCSNGKKKGDLPQSLEPLSLVLLPKYVFPKFS